MNASTFTARVVASTGSDLCLAVVAAIGALKGPLHGGAPGPVLDMLDAIGEPDARGGVARRRARGRPAHHGHGAPHLPRAGSARGGARARGRAAGGGVGRRSAAASPLARAVETGRGDAARGALPGPAAQGERRVLHGGAARRGRAFRATLFTPTFAVGRVAGWCAHVAEQQASARLIRPSSRYIGAVP